MNVRQSELFQSPESSSSADIFGVPVRAASMDGMLEMVDGWIAGRGRHFICTVDVHALMESQANDDVRRIYASEDVVVAADGMPLVWYLRSHGHPEAERICGPDLMPALLGRSATGASYRHFLYGASEETLARLRSRILTEFPEAQIVGAYAPPFRELSDREDAEIVEMLNSAAPDIIWVGLGAPKQDRWMEAHRAALSAPVLIGVGAAFDMLAGNVRRAPRIFQRTGCEWLFRIVQEPRRLLKRYLKSNSQFAFLVIGEMLSLQNR